MIPININPDMKAMAKYIANGCQESLSKKEPNDYTNLNVKHRWYCGFLGEQVFKRLLDVNNKKYAYDIKTDGIADDGDFTLYLLNHTFKVDVKTACQRTHTKLMLPDKQFQAYHYDYYIGVRLNEPMGEVWGYCTRDDFKLKKEGFDEQNVPTRYKSLKSLTPIEELLEMIT